MQLMRETNSPYAPDPPRSSHRRALSEVVREVALPQTQPFDWSGLFARLSNYAGSFLQSRYAVLTMRLLLASVFLLSSLGKIVDITQYSIKPVVEFGILPGSVAIVFGAVLPFIELLCALGLLFGVWTRLASLGIAAMSLAFFSTKMYLLMQGYDLACGCFGAIVTTFMSFTVYLDPPIFLMAMAVMLAPLSSRQWLSIGSALRGRPCRREAAPGREKNLSREDAPCHSARIIALFGQNK